MFKTTMKLVGLLMVACGCLIGTSLFAQSVTRDIKIVEAKEGKLTMTDLKGESEITVAVSKSAKITLDGKTAKLEDLKKDYKATITGEKIDNEKMITSIEARSK